MSCYFVLLGFPGIAINQEPTDHIHIRILQTMFSGLLLAMGLGSRREDRYV